MNKKGYRNPTPDFYIDSQVEQFNFKLTDTHLRLDLNELKKIELAPVERVDIYLRDNRLLKNVFIVNSELAYYFEKEWYYEYDDIREGPRSPIENIYERFDFKKEDMLLIYENNTLYKPCFDPGYIFTIEWLFGEKPNRYDTRLAINKNIMIKIKHFKTLPKNIQKYIYFSQ